MLGQHICFGIAQSPATRLLPPFDFPLACQQRLSLLYPNPHYLDFRFCPAVLAFGRPPCLSPAQTALQQGSARSQLEQASLSIEAFCYPEDQYSTSAFGRDGALSIRCS